MLVKQFGYNNGLDIIVVNIITEETKQTPVNV